MDFSLKRCGAHFCPPPIWAAKKACFLPPFQGFGHVAHMFFRFLLHRFCVFLHDFCIFSRFFVKFSACANANWQISGVICCVFDDHPMQISRIFPICTVEITQHTLLYGWNYPVHPSVRLKLPSTPSVWLKLSCTPFCTVEITQHTPCMVEITQHALKGQKLLAQGNALGIRQSAMRPVRAKALKYT